MKRVIAKCIEFAAEKFKYGFLVVLLALLMALLYLSIHGLPESFTRTIERRLQFSGMVLSLDKIKLGVFEGVIASRVRCHRKGDIGDPVFEAEKVVLHFSPRNWLRGENGVTGARIKNGLVRLLIDARKKEGDANAGRRMLTFEHVYAHVKLDQPSRLQVVDFSTTLLGMTVTGRGELMMPKPSESLSRSGTSDHVGNAGGMTPFVDEAVQWANTVCVSNALNVDVQFLVDPSDIQRLNLCLTITSRNMVVEKSRVGAWHARIGVRGKAGQGIITIQNCNAQGIWIEKGVCRFQFDEQGLKVEKLDAMIGRAAGRGPLNLSLLYDWKSRQFKGHVSSGFNPNILLPFLRQKFRRPASVIEMFAFTQTPPCGASDFRGRLGPQWFFRMEGQMQAKDLAYCKVPVQLMKTAFTVDGSLTNEVITLAPLLVVRPEGSVQGWASVNMNAQTISFDAASTMEPKALTRMIDPFIERLVMMYRFEGPVRAAAWGTVGFTDSWRDDMELAVDSQRAGWHMFLADTCSLRLRVLGDVTEITDLQGRIYQGQFNGSASVYPVVGVSNTYYEVEADVQDVDFSQLMDAMMGRPSEIYEGNLSAHLILSGFVGEGQGRTAKGEGWIHIDDGRIFQIPLFGGLSDFLTRLIPGLSVLLRQTDAKASIVIEDGKIHSDEILIEGDVLSLIGKGDYYLDGTLDFRVQVKLWRKHTLAADVFRWVTLPVSKMLEFHLGGTVSSPRWRPVYIPKEMFLIFE